MAKILQDDFRKPLNTYTFSFDWMVMDENFHTPNGGMVQMWENKRNKLYID